MRMYFNRDLGLLVGTAGANVPLAEPLTFKRRDASELEIGFCRTNVRDLDEMPETMEIRWAMKKQKNYSGPLVVFTADFVLDAEARLWKGEQSLNTEQLNALFVPPDSLSVPLMAELSWRTSESGGWVSSQTLDVVVENDVIIGDEGTPEDAEAPEDYLTAAQSNGRFFRFDVTNQTLTETHIENMIARLGLEMPAKYHSEVLTTVGTTKTPLISLPPGEWIVEVMGMYQVPTGESGFDLTLTLEADETIGGAMDDNSVSLLLLRSTGAWAGGVRPGQVVLTAVPSTSGGWLPIRGSGVVVVLPEEDPAVLSLTKVKAVNADEFHLELTVTARRVRPYVAP